MGQYFQLKIYPNPYLSPVTISRRSDVILYTELPSRCPSCDKKFSEVNFRRRFKRKILWSTFSYMLLVSIAGYVLVALLLPTILFWPTYLCIVIPVLGNAMTSLIAFVPDNNITRRSSPKAMPPWGGAPNSSASSKKPNFDCAASSDRASTLKIARWRSGS